MGITTDWKPNQNQLDYLLCLKSIFTKEAIPSEWLMVMDWDGLFELAFSQSQSEMLYFYCENKNINVSKKLFSMAKSCYDHGIHRELLMNHEREAIYQFLDSNKIWHCSLKGINIQNLYPGVGLRYASDNDILVDPAYCAQIRDYMVSKGYEIVEYNEKAFHDAYVKNPSYHFEIHRFLLDKGDRAEAEKYFNNIFPNLIRVSEDNYRYAMTVEDEYIYLVLHMFNHYCSNGIGLRGLIDTYLLLEANKEILAEEKLTSRLEKYGILPFEEDMRSLAYRIFKGNLAEASAREMDLLKLMFAAGCHGNEKGEVINFANPYAGKGQRGKRGRFAFVLHKFFPDSKYIEKRWPFIYRTKIFIPFLLIFRPVRSLFNGKMKKYLNAMKSIEKEE